MPRSNTAFLFDLDGTLVDSVYQHVLAWKEALDREGVVLPVWTIHRKIGMSGGLFTNILLRETGLAITEDRIKRSGTWRRSIGTIRRARSGRCPARANCWIS
jgi:beta-phosphoglucomutase-like phosphatase (HAD superfamily)